MKSLLLTSTAIIAMIGAASAADLAPRPYMKAAPVASPAYNWTGFYIGAMGGYGWSDQARLGGLTASTSEFKGGFAGGTVGYNWQQPGSQFVFGIEADAAWSDIKASETSLGVTVEDKFKSMGSVTGRLGFAADNALFYVKGGYAWADNRLSGTVPGFVTISESKVHSGWTIGGGLEYGFSRNWSLKGEYMYASFSNESYILLGGLTLGADIHTVKGGINYRF